MTRKYDFQSELTATRQVVASVLREVADGLLTGSVQLDDGADTVVVDIPEELILEIELEHEEDTLSLELELEWPHTEGGESISDLSEGLPPETGVSSVPVQAADESHMRARFELYRDEGDEWRWRLRHRNGNIIATAGQSYSQKHNAQKGLRSVMQNASGAESIEGSED